MRTKEQRTIISAGAGTLVGLAMLTAVVLGACGEDEPEGVCYVVEVTGETTP